MAGGVPPRPVSSGRAGTCRSERRARNLAGPATSSGRQPLADACGRTPTATAGAHKEKNVTLPLVIGVGNEYRGDDAVGLLVARRVRELAPGLARILEQSGEGAALMEAWRGATAVIICDAVCSGAEPGTVHRLDAAEREVPRQFFNYSTHAFSVAEAVEMARVLGELPARLRIYGIEGAEWDAGAPLSVPVRRAVEQVAGEIADLLRAIGNVSQHA